MEENNTTPVKEEQCNAPSEELTKEKLFLKCKNLLTIAQKAKLARDDCLERNKLMTEENEKLNSKINKLEKDLVIAQEMLATFTEQKLKLSMLMDELKKERKQLAEDNEKLSSTMCQHQTENVDLKKHNSALLNENEDLTQQLIDVEARLKSALTLQCDIDKLQENNENIKHLCSNVTQEKLELEKECRTLSNKLTSMANQWKKFQDFMTDKFKSTGTDMETWILEINNNLEAKTETKTDPLNSEIRLKLAEEAERFNKLNLDFNETASNLSSAISEKNDLECQLKNSNQQNEQLKNELDLLNVDKDKIMNNLENMRIETRQLIESSDKLSEEIELLKFDKSKIENDYSIVLEERNNLNLELSVKSNEINRLNVEINSLVNEVSLSKSKISTFEKSCDNAAQLQEKLKNQLEVNHNLNLKIDHLNEQLKHSEDKLVESVSELTRVKGTLEKSVSSENSLKSELESALENSVALENKLKELESTTRINSAINEVIDEKDRAINFLKTEVDNLRLKFENNDDSFNKQLESLRFEKEELKCLADTLREEATENNTKYSEQVKEKEELLSQSLIREKKIFEEFKCKLIELQNSKDKLAVEKSEIEQNCTAKSTEIDELNLLVTDLKKKIEIFENDNSCFSKQLNDLNSLLATASHLNTRYENELKEAQSESQRLSGENDKLISDLNSLKNTLNEFTSKQEESSKSVENLKSELNSAQEDIKCKENKTVELEKQLESFTTSYNELLIKFDQVSKDLTEKSNEMEQNNQMIQSLENNLKNFKELELRLQETELENVKLKEQSTEKHQLEGDMTKVIADISSKYQEEVGSLENSLRDRSNELESCRRTWFGHLTVLKGAFFGLKHSYDDLKKSVRDLQDFSAMLQSLTPINFQEKVDLFIAEALQTNKQDLLGEMQHMNQALKQRGEVISKLQNSLSEMEQKMLKSNEEAKDLEKSLAETSTMLEDKEKQLKFKELFIKDLETEIIRFKETNDSMTDGDVMSSSTISKAEESARLKDIEDSFEDKYAKLKLLAMKLKKRVNDLSSALEEEKVKHAAERSELIEKIQTLTLAAKNAQKLQESFDSVMDNLEEEKKKGKQLDTSLQTALKVQQDLKADIFKLESDTKKIPNMRKHIESLTLNLSNSKKESTMVQKEKEVEVIKYTELKKEKTKLEERLSELTASLEQAQQQSRNNNLLELEMNNYEKTIEELSAQLNSEKDKLHNIKGEMESMSSVKSGLEEQIKLLENQLKIEEERNQLVNTQLASVKETLVDVQSQLSRMTERCDTLEKELQEEKQKYEAMAIQASTVTSQFTVKEKELETQLNTFQRVVCGLESKVANSEEEATRCKAELDRVQSEFDSYRTRAQAVLAKQRGETVSHAEREASEQIDKLNNENLILTNRIDALMSELEMMKAESITYGHEKERSDRRTADLNKLIQRKALELDKINSEFRSFKISTETLKQCYKNELEEKEMSYKTLIEDYKNQIVNLLNANKLLESQLDPSQGVCLPEEETTVQTDSLPQQREEGEGSESVPSPQLKKRSTSLVPLDVLLNTPYDSESRIGLLCDRITLLEKEVSSYEVRCRHLAGLLSEAERDSARNSQLNSLLKEEIRRLERSLQRQPHAANTEYLKNVIFKFVTLQSGDEKTRLVPVLDTILKLSPDEITKLNAVAKGDTASGWSNYLTSWTGL